MMADIVNLKQVRKGRARDEKEKRAEENRARFGRSKAAKDLQKAQSEQARRGIDQHKLSDD